MRQAPRFQIRQTVNLIVRICEEIMLSEEIFHKYLNSCITKKRSCKKFECCKHWTGLALDWTLLETTKLNLMIRYGTTLASRMQNNTYACMHAH